MTPRRQGGRPRHLERPLGGARCDRAGPDQPHGRDRRPGRSSTRRVAAGRPRWPSCRCGESASSSSLAVGVLAGACTDDKDAGPSPSTRDHLVDVARRLHGRGSCRASAARRPRPSTRRAPPGWWAPCRARAGRSPARPCASIASSPVARSATTSSRRPTGGGSSATSRGVAIGCGPSSRPCYAQTGAELRFLADGEEHTFDLKVEDQRGVVVRADVAPDQPLLGDPR